MTSIQSRTSCSTSEFAIDNVLHMKHTCSFFIFLVFLSSSHCTEILMHVYPLKLENVSVLGCYQYPPPLETIFIKEDQNVLTNVQNNSVQSVLCSCKCISTEFLVGWHSFNPLLTLCCEFIVIILNLFEHICELVTIIYHYCSVRFISFIIFTFHQL